MQVVPIVLLNDGSTLEVQDYEHGVRIRDSISSILFMGDMLVGFGEFIQNNYRLVPAGYNEEWWYQELLSKGYQENEKHLNSIVTNF